MLDAALIIKIVSYSIGALLVAKLIAPFFGQALWDLFFGTKKKKNSDLDLDAMISQRKAMMRGGSEGVDASVNLKANAGGKDETEKIIQKEYSALSKKSERSATEEKRFEEIKKLLKILDSVQWGNIPEIDEMTKKLSGSHAHRFPPATPAFSFLLKRSAFIDSKGSWVGLDKSFSILESYVFLSELLQSSTLRSLMAKRWQMDSLSLDKSIHLKMNRKASLSKLAKAGAVPPLVMKDLEILSYLIISPGVIKNKSTVINELKEGAEIFNALSPLPPLKGKNDREGALKSLGLGANATVDQIKSKYKKLARLKHPDTLKAKGIPEEFESIATENFTQIKAAYDILIK